MTGEEEKLQLEPFVHIQRDDDGEDEGAESQNKTNHVDERILLLNAGNSSVQADPETKMGGEGELSEEAKVIKASKTIDEALNEVDDSYWKHQQSKDNETKDKPELATQNQTAIGENHSEVNEVTKNHSDARKPSEKQSASQNTNLWEDHSHEAVNRTVSLIKEKNKKLKIERGVEEVEDPARVRVKREGIPIFLESKGFQKSDSKAGLM